MHPARKNLAEPVTGPFRHPACGVPIFASRHIIRIETSQLSA